MLGYKGLGSIITLHRVFPAEAKKLQPNENLKVSPFFLEKFIVDALHKGYVFISLDQMYDVLSGNGAVSKFIVLTLDDGYADNFIYGFPIFKKFNIPFAIYISTSFPDNRASLWWYVLEDVVISHDSIELTDGYCFECKTPKQKIETFMALRNQIIEIPEDMLIHGVNDMFGFQYLNPDVSFNNLTISWDQLKEISLSPLATIGAHTVNHYALSKLTEKRAIEEILGSKSVLEKVLGRSVDHFCYPFGTEREAGDREFKLVRNLGFKTAVTTRFGNVFPGHANSLWSLPRVMLTNNFSWRTFEYRLIKRFLKGPVVSV